MRLRQLSASLSFLTLLPALALSQANQWNKANLVLENFEDGDLSSEVGWEWDYFTSNNADTISVGIEKDSQGNNMLVAEGSIPDGENSFGGVLYAPVDRALNSSQSRSLIAFKGIRFRAASHNPGYYTIRIEQQGVGHESTKVVFPLNETMETFTIPFSKFETGVSKTIAVVIAPHTWESGDPFHLMLDNVTFLSEAPEESATTLLKQNDWVASPKVAWQNANFHNKPLLCYFTNEVEQGARDFEAKLAVNREFPTVAEKFVLARVDTAQAPEIAERYNVEQVPTFLVFEPSSGRSSTLYTGDDPSVLTNLMRQLYDAWAKTNEADRDSARSQQYQITTVDEFSDGNLGNDWGGVWGAFSAGDTGAIFSRHIDTGGGNLALETLGTFPGQPGGVTWGGVYCKLTADPSSPANLQKYGWVSFEAYSAEPGYYLIHIEQNPELRTSHVPIQLTQKQQRITLQLAQFNGLSPSMNTLVWTKPQPQPGAKFHLVLDNVMFIE